MTSIGTLREGPLHAALKAWVALPGDRFEVPVDGHVIDVVRGDHLIEIQTGGFAPLRRKLDVLLDRHSIRIVAPIPYRSRITKIDAAGEIVDERWSPKRGSRLSIFERLVSFPSLLDHPNLTLTVVGIHQRELRTHHPDRAWRRRGWVVEERHLDEVVDTIDLASPEDLLALLPALDDEFTTAQLATLAGISRRLAQQTVYCLRLSGLAEEVARSGNTRLYRLLAR